MHPRKPQTSSLLNAIDTVLAREKRWIILLFALAFLLKLIFVLQSRNSLQITSPILDARYYNEMAKDIAAGHFVRKEAFFMGPLYPYTLALLYSVFGKSLMIARLIQIAGGSLTVILTYLIGSRAFRPSVAMLGALLLALYGASTFYEGQMLMMWLGTLLNMLLLFVLLGKSGKAEITSISDENNTLKFILAGVLLGLSSLARSNILIILPVVLVWLLFINKGNRRFISASVFVVSAFAVILPATIHNYAASKDFVLITSNGGVNFYIGNNPEATGTYNPPVGIDFNIDPTTRGYYVERRLGRDLKPSEISRYWISQSLSFVKKHPWRELTLLLRKTMLYFNGFEWPQIESLDLSKTRYGIFRVLFVNFWMLSSLGLVGVIYSLRKWRRLFLLHWFLISYSLSIILFFVTDRYRIPIAPVLSLFAAYTILEVFPEVFGRTVRNFLPLILFGVILFLTSPGLFPIDQQRLLWYEHIHQAWRWGTIGKPDKSLGEINKAVQLYPEDPESYLQRAVININSGRQSEAINDYYMALSINPIMPRVHFKLGQAFQNKRMYAASVQEYLTAIEQDPLMTEAYNNLGITYQLMKEYNTAIRYFKKTIHTDQNYIKAYNNAGAALAEQGDIDAAIPFFSEAIKRNPAYPHSYKNLAMAYIAKNRLPEARMNLELSLKLAPGDTLASRVLHELIIEMERQSNR